MQQRLDRARSCFPRAQFENLAKQNQNRDDGGGFEIHGDRATMAAERRRKQRQERERDPLEDARSGQPSADGEDPEQQKPYG